MCDGVVIHENGKRTHCGTQGDLRAAGLVLVSAAGYGIDNAFVPEMCLCPIDLEATAESSGFKFTRIDPATSEHDPFDVHFIKEQSND